MFSLLQDYSSLMLAKCVVTSRQWWYHMWFWYGLIKLVNWIKIILINSINLHWRVILTWICPVRLIDQTPCTVRPPASPPAEWRYSSRRWPTSPRSRYSHRGPAATSETTTETNWHKPRSLAWTGALSPASWEREEHWDSSVSSHDRSPHRRRYTRQIASLNGNNLLISSHPRQTSIVWELKG